MSSADDLDDREPPSPSDNGKACVRMCTFRYDDWVSPLLRHTHMLTYTSTAALTGCQRARCVAGKLEKGEKKQEESVRLLTSTPASNGPGSAPLFAYVKCFYTCWSCTDGGHVSFGVWPRRTLPVSTLSGPGRCVCLFSHCEL